MMNKILIERQNMYGSFKDNAKVATFLKKHTIPFTNKTHPILQEGFNMIFSKVSRIVVGDWLYEDSWIDIKGYLYHVDKYFKSLEYMYFDNDPLHNNLMNYKKKYILSMFRKLTKRFNKRIIVSVALRGIVKSSMEILYLNKNLNKDSYTKIYQEIHNINTWTEFILCLIKREKRC